MYSRIPYLNISLISWAIHRSNLRCLFYYSRACSGTPPSAPLHALEERRYFLEGAWHLVEIWMDHKNLEYFITAKKLNRCQAHWSLYLAYFDFKWIHHPGRSMGKPDALSQRPDHGNGASNNKDVILLWLELLAIRALEGVQLEGPEKDILREIHQRNQKGDQKEPVAKAVRELR